MNINLVKRLRRVKGIGFDLDGTIVDSKLDFKKMREDLGFPTSLPILEHLDTISSTKHRQDALDIINRHEEEGAKRATLIDGVAELLNFFKSMGLPTGILTRNSQKVAQASLERFDLKFDIILSRDTARAKPDPHGLTIMANRWNISTEEIAFFGDSSFDINTAINARSLPIFYSASSGEITHEEVGFNTDEVLVIQSYRELLNSILNSTLN